jgi:type II secretory pathway pseudopilin PulG
MVTPNWQHHSKKEQKRSLKPQAMRARREALRQFKKRHMNRPDKAVSSYYESIRTNDYDCPPRNQVSTR